jgi:ABC-type lipoprotein release transport system permease subunit
MVTEDFAKSRGLDLDDKIPMGLENKYEVVAMLDVSGAARIAGGEAFITLKEAQKLLGQGPIVDTIFISLKHGRDAKTVSDYARELIGEGVSITTEGNVDRGTAALAQMTRKVLLASSAFVLLFVFLMLLRNALESVTQRVAEVGLMKAIGWQNTDVSRLFVAEAAYAAIIGGLLGSSLGSLIGWLYGQFANLKLPETLSSFPDCASTEAPLDLPLATNPSAMIFILGLVLALAIGIIAGLAASRRAAKLDPVDALRRL